MPNQWRPRKRVSIPWMLWAPWLQPGTGSIPAESPLRAVPGPPGLTWSHMVIVPVSKAQRYKGKTLKHKHQGPQTATVLWVQTPDQISSPPTDAGRMPSNTVKHAKPPSWDMGHSLILYSVLSRYQLTLINSPCSAALLLLCSSPCSSRTPPHSHRFALP